MMVYRWTTRSPSNSHTPWHFLGINGNVVPSFFSQVTLASGIATNELFNEPVNVYGVWTVIRTFMRLQIQSKCVWSLYISLDYLMILKFFTHHCLIPHKTFPFILPRFQSANTNSFEILIAISRRSEIPLYEMAT